MKTREYLEDQIALLLGGRAAEQVLLQTMTAGASNDIERAVEIARKMVTEYGMSSLGPIHLGRPEDPRSQMLLDRVEHAVGEITDAQMKRACQIVETSRRSIACLVESLMERDTLDAEEIQACFEFQDDSTVRDKGFGLDLSNTAGTFGIPGSPHISTANLEAV